MTAIIKLQSAGGSFKWGNAVETVLGKTKEEAMKTKPAEDDSDTSWITALMVAVLRIKFEPSKELWELVADKAIGYLTAVYCNEMYPKRMVMLAEDVVNGKST